MKINKKLLLRVLAGFFCLLILTGFWARWRPAKRFDFQSPHGSHFRVVTWNVGYFAPVADKNLIDADIPLVATMIADLEVDVVVLQELGREEQAGMIAAELGEDWQVHVAETGHGNQVMAVLSPLPFLEEDAFICGGRTTLGVSLKAQNGQAVYVLGVHSPHPARGMAENVQNIRCSLEHVLERPEPIRIVTGDLNYNFDAGADGEFYTEIMTHYGDGTLALGETYYAQTRIDHVFHIPKDLPVVLEGSGIVDLPLRFAKVPGFRDHRPLVVTFDLDPRRSEKLKP